MAGVLRCQGAGNNGDFLHLLPSSHYPLLLSSYPNSLFHLEIPTPLCLPPRLVAFYLCVWVCVCVCDRERWLDALCHGVRWHQLVVDGKIKCNTIDIRALKLFSFPGALCTTCVHIAVDMWAPFDLKREMLYIKWSFCIALLSNVEVQQMPVLTKMDNFILNQNWCKFNHIPAFQSNYCYNCWLFIVTVFICYITIQAAQSNK